MRKLFTFLAVIAVAFIATAPCHATTTFNPPGDSLVLKAFPNPTADRIKIESLDPNLDLWNAKIVIYSLNGEQVFTRQFTDGILNLNTISKNRVQSSIYIIAVVDENGSKIQSMKVVKFRD